MNARINWRGRNYSKATPLALITVLPHTVYPYRNKLNASHRRLASNNIRTIERLNAVPGVDITVRVETNQPPEALRQAAESAAHSGDLRSRLTTDLAPHGSLPWDELRVWDPGD
jgi:hypothetical protein